MKKQYTTTYLKDYQPSHYQIDNVDLIFDLDEEKTLVTAKLAVVKNPNVAKKNEPLVLVGEHLVLRSLQMDGHELPKDSYHITDNKLTLLQPSDKFDLTIVTEIYPQKNTALTGLYKSNQMFCTQCEAEGFRRITYFLDRPDVMSRYTTKIIANKTRYPILLSNGNMIEKGDLPDNKHFVQWQDPFRKPSYLFALVAGNLAYATDEFITQSGRKVALEIFVAPENLEKVQHAMYSVKEAMRWDEVTFGREYDLDIYMIVAVSDFNMGAMENKGLNLFNTKFILANPDEATDDDYQAILGVIGHEYFHNWSGNRVTCRDWFQLSLKEGLTIYRDQEFSGDMTGRAVNRIQDVRILRTSQFAEDAGPMAHPVQPDSYIEINNFYTNTIYNKGAEVIRMMKTLLGKEGFRRAMDLYFERHDGQAVTIEEFVKAMEDANQFDLKQFRLWYKQAGTPKLSVTRRYDEKQKEYHLTIAQSCPPTPGQAEKKPFHIPIAMSLLDTDGSTLPIHLKGDSRYKNAKTCILELKEKMQTFIFTDITKVPIPSLLHEFSAPVELSINYSNEELSLLMQHAPDPFCRWEATQSFFIKLVEQFIHDYHDHKQLSLPTKFIEALKVNLNNTELDSSFIARLISMPDEKYICSMQTNIDIDAIHSVRDFILKEIVRNLHNDFLNIYQNYPHEVTYNTEQASIAKRELKNISLEYLTLLEDSKYFDLAFLQYQKSNNMTDRLAALRCMVNSKNPQKQSCLHDFYQRYQKQPLVIDKWFSLQALSNQEDVFDDVMKLTKHEAFNIKNPNRLRSLIYVFCSFNMFYFHRTDGAGYQLLADYIIELNALNPQLAARIMEPFIGWRRFDAKRQKLMKEQLERIAKVSNLSNDLYEIIDKSLHETI